MKRPGNPENLKKIVVAAVLAAGLVVFGLKVGVMNPLNRRLERLIEHVEKAENDQAALRDYLRRAHTQQLDRLSILEILAQRTRTTDFVLEPRMGSYEVAVRQQVLDWAAQAGISPDPEFRGRPEPQAVRWSAQRAIAPTLTAYSATVTFNTDLPAMLKFLAALESQSPVCNVTRLTINADARTPRQHRVSMELDWPAWAHERAPVDLTNTVTRVMARFSEEAP